MSISLSRPLAVGGLFVCIAGVLFAYAWKPSGPVVKSPAPAPAHVEQTPLSPASSAKPASGSNLSAFYAGAADDKASDADSDDDVPAPADDSPARSIQPPNVTIVQQQASSELPSRPIGPVPASPIE